MPSVLLFREPTVPDPYEAAFRSAGYEVRFLPLLAYRAVNAEGLREALLRPERYRGLVLTSPRAVQALEAAFMLLPAQLSEWQAKPCYAVGPATARSVQAIGFGPRGEECGTAAALAGLLEREQGEGTLLFLSGDRRLPELPSRLAAAGIPVEELTVYATEPHPDIRPFEGEAPAWAVFFSPSGVAEAAARLQLPWERVRRAAIGPTTAAALLANGLPAEAVAEAPEPEALLRAIQTSAAVRPNESDSE